MIIQLHNGSLEVKKDSSWAKVEVTSGGGKNRACQQLDRSELAAHIAACQSILKEL